MACAEEETALARRDRAQREVDQLQAEMDQLKRDQNEVQQRTMRNLTDAEAMKSVVASLESGKAAAERQGNDLLAAVMQQRQEIEQLQKDKQELDAFLTTGLPAHLTAEMRSEAQMLAAQVKERNAARELAVARRRKAEQERQPLSGQTDDWSSKVTVGDESTGRMADADDELRIQQTDAALGIDAFSNYINSHLTPSLD